MGGKRYWVNVWAIVPVKPLNRARSRLAATLPAEFRENFAIAMLRHTITTLVDSRAVSGILAISRDNRALVVARKHGARTVQESGTPELNLALERASRMIASWNAKAALILPSDLPLLLADDVRALVDLGRFHQSAVIVPDRHEKGTNGLLLRPPGLMSLQFGEDSYQRHRQAAEAAGADVHVFQTERLMLDTDTPEDVLLYLKLCEKYQVAPLVDFTVENMYSLTMEPQKEDS